MRTLLLTTACAFALASGIANADEHQAPPGMKMPGQGMMGMGGDRMNMMEHPLNIRIMMILMDNDGDGALSLEEFQSAHTRIFKQVDADKDGKITLNEVQLFFQDEVPASNH